MLKKSGKLLLCSILYTAIFTFPAQASLFDIDINFGNGLTDSQESIFTQAENYWENTIQGYQGDINIGSLSITASAKYMDSVGGKLGSGGPRSITQREGYWLPTSGSMEYDRYDIDKLETDGTLYDVIVHEMAHVMGFGTLWKLNDVYSSNGLYQYTGASALAAYQAEYDADATSVPVENNGGSGTAGGHWETDIFDNELMTGWLNPSTFISQTTLASFEDIGYTLSPNSTPVPIPATLILMGTGLLGLVGIKRRRV